MALHPCRWTQSKRDEECTRLFETLTNDQIAEWAIETNPWMPMILRRSVQVMDWLREEASDDLEYWHERATEQRDERRSNET